MKNLERRWIYHYNGENNIYTMTYILNTCDAIGLLSKFCKIGSSNPIAVQCYYKIKEFLDGIAVECYNIFRNFIRLIAIECYNIFSFFLKPSQSSITHLWQ